MPAESELQINYQQIKTAVIIAIIIGLLTSFFFLMVEKESYSSLYLLPKSIVHDPNNNTVYYVYGITSSETQKMDYALETYVGDELVKTKQFSLNNGETLEERVMTRLPEGIQYPEKITLILNTSSTSVYVHFWITDQIV